MGNIVNTEELTRRTQQAIEAVKNDRFIIAIQKEIESIISLSPAPSILINAITMQAEPNKEMSELVQFYITKINERQDAILRAYGVESKNANPTA